MVWVLVDFLLSGCDSPPGRLLIASPYSGGAIRIVVFGASVSIGFCGLMLFCCFSVGLKTFDCSFAFDLSELIAPLGLHARRTRLFSQVSSSLAHGLVASLPRLSHALLNIQKFGGAQAYHPREDNPAVLVASLRFRHGYRLAVCTQPL